MEDKENTSNSIQLILLDISKHEQKIPKNPIQKQLNNQSILEHTQDTNEIEDTIAKYVFAQGVSINRLIQILHHFIYLHFFYCMSMYLTKSQIRRKANTVVYIFSCFMVRSDEPSSGKMFSFAL